MFVVNFCINANRPNHSFLLLFKAVYLNIALAEKGHLKKTMVGKNKSPAFCSSFVQFQDI